MVKNTPASAGDIRDTGSIPRFGRLPGGGQGNPLHIFAWRTPWTEEPGGTFHSFLGPNAHTGAQDFPSFWGPIRKSWVSFWGAGTYSSMAIPSRTGHGTQFESGATSRAGQLSLLLSQRGLNANDQTTSFFRLL